MGDEVQDIGRISSWEKSFLKGRDNLNIRGVFININLLEVYGTVLTEVRWVILTA